MGSTLAPARSTARQPTALRRVGHVMAIAVNAIMLWMVARLLEWGWPAFLTEDFVEVEWLVSASLVAGIIVNAAFLVHDRGHFRALGDLVTNGFGLAVTMRTWAVFPFDFSGYATDWTWLVRTVLVIAIVGTAIGIVASLAKFLGGSAPQDA